jgi:type IV secretion system protein VirD4
VLVAPSARQRILAPIVVSLLEELRRTYYARAREGAPARLGLILDELANVAPIPSLGSILSEGVSQGVWLLGAVQDLAQVRERWPSLERGLLTLFGTVLVLGGIGDTATLAALSALVGEEEVAEVARHEGPRGTSRTIRRARRRRIEPSELRRLQRGQGLVLELAGDAGIVELRGLAADP